MIAIILYGVYIERSRKIKYPRKFCILNKPYYLDFETFFKYAILKKLQNYKIDTIICHHVKLLTSFILL